MGIGWWRARGGDGCGNGYISDGDGEGVIAGESKFERKWTSCGTHFVPLMLPVPLAPCPMHSTRTCSGPQCRERADTAQSAWCTPKTGAWVHGCKGKGNPQTAERGYLPRMVLLTADATSGASAGVWRLHYRLGMALALWFSVGISPICLRVTR